MGVFEEAKIRFSDIQKRIMRVREAGEVLTRYRSLGRTNPSFE